MTHPTTTLLTSEPPATNVPEEPAGGEAALDLYDLPLPKPLQVIIQCSRTMATQHRIPQTAVMIHALSAASALARGLVSSAKAGPPVLPLLVVSPESPPPCWIAYEWEVLEGLNDLCHDPLMLDHPQTRAALRRRERLRKMFDPQEMLVPHIYRTLISNRLCFGRSVVTHGTRKLATSNKSHPLTHLCASLPRVRAVLRRTCQGRPGESLIGCVNTLEFSRLVREQGVLLTGRIGQLLSVPASQPCDFAKLDRHCVTSLINQFLVRSLQGRTPFVYDPGPDITRELDRHAAKRESWDLPQFIRSLLPDPDRVWHMATLFASLCDREDPTAAGCAAALAMTFDGWATAHHLHLIRYSYPADANGWFESTDLAVFRQLGEKPQKLRDIQRRLRGVRKDACLASLRRAIDAGLALESPDGVYQLPPPPSFDLRIVGKP